MSKLIVNVNKLNQRTSIPASLSDKTTIAGTVNKGFTFSAEEVKGIENPLLGRWYKDSNDYYYWGGGLDILEEDDDRTNKTDQGNSDAVELAISPIVKRKIEQVINVFETGSAAGNYAALVRLKDYKDPQTGQLIAQVTFGRSQTTEFGHLKSLIQDYIAQNGVYTAQLKPYFSRIGQKPSLATDTAFCKALTDAGKSDAIMRECQDRLFETRYYMPAFNWFTQNGFRLPLSMLVIYDSQIHSGGILPFLRRRFPTTVPSNGGDEKSWITNYVNARHTWLANHSNTILHGTVYRTNCFTQQMKAGNWDLSQPVKANGITIS